MVKKESDDTTPAQMALIVFLVLCFFAGWLTLLVHLIGPGLLHALLSVVLTGSFAQLVVLLVNRKCRQGMVVVTICAGLVLLAGGVLLQYSLSPEEYHTTILVSGIFGVAIDVILP